MFFARMQLLVAARGEYLLLFNYYAAWYSKSEIIQTEGVAA